MTYAADLGRAGVDGLLYYGADFHPKTICVDSRFSSIGSANLDIRSFAIDDETNLVICDATLSCDLEDDFLDDLTHCVPVDDADAYAATRASSRLVNSIERLASTLN